MRINKGLLCVLVLFFIAVVSCTVLFFRSSGSPHHILNMDVPLGNYRFGEVTAYSNVDSNMSGVEYGDYAMAVNIYVSGSNYPIPTSGKDYMGLQDITINSNAIAVETPFELELVQMSF